jgi:hypothetical protein
VPDGGSLLFGELSDDSLLVLAEVSSCGLLVLGDVIDGGLLLGAVVLTDQRPWISSDSLGDAADVAPCIEVTATSRIIITLDGGDDRSRDASTVADIGHGHAGLKPRRHEDFADAHIASGAVRHGAPSNARRRR